MKSFDSALLVGRLQHPHVGHEHLINSALSVAGRVVILLGSSQEIGTIKNPFSTITRADIIREIFPNKEEVIIGEIPDIDMGIDKPITDEWAHHVLDYAKIYLHKVPELMVHGSTSPNTNWFKINSSLAFRTQNMSELTVSRNRYVISATRMRTYLLEDLEEQWQKYVNPHLHKYYNRLRSELLNAPGYSEIVKKMHPQKPWEDKPTILT